MKVISRDTNKVANLIVDGAYKFVSKFVVEDDEGNRIAEYDSLKALYSKWKDYEEPFSTSFYTIVDGKIKHCIFYRERIAGCPSNTWAYLKEEGRERIEQLKKVGLYFETEKEAAKAVEKLKAWKRLKDKGFRFTKWDCTERVLNFQLPDTFFDSRDEYGECISEETAKDLDLLFGGENE